MIGAPGAVLDHCRLFPDRNQVAVERVVDLRAVPGLVVVPFGQSLGEVVAPRPHITGGGIDAQVPILAVASATPANQLRAPSAPRLDLPC